LAKYGEMTGAAVPCTYRTVSAREKYMPFQKTILKLDRNDILFLPEHTEVEHDIELVKRALNASGEIVVLVHDLIPLSYRETCDPSHVDHACYWFKTILPLADRIISPTKATALEVEDFMRRFPFKRLKKIGWFHHGADLDEINQSPAKEVSNTVRALRDIPIFLSVGTLEPRKCHHIALDAFDLLWRAGLDVCYIICGKKGWNAEALEKRILTHAELGSRLFWFKDASDADLALLYKSSSSLIFSSIAEGFGLPFIEAMRYGTPVIASDIPVFREIGQDFATYFTVADADSLAKAIRDALNTGFKAPNCKLATWDEVGELVFGLVRDDPRFGDNWVGS
jgi:alpha-1,2-rhamnosyltransferase